MSQHCPPAAEPQYYQCWGWGAVEGIPGTRGGAQAAGWAACSCHSAPWSWLAAAGGRCYCPVTVKSRQSAGTNPHPDGWQTGRPAGGGTLGPGHHSPQSRWRLLLLPPPAPGMTSSHRRASRSCRSMLSSAFFLDVAASACAPVLDETHGRKTIWYRESRDGVSPTVPCNLT